MELTKKDLYQLIALVRIGVDTTTPEKAFELGELYGKLCSMLSKVEPSKKVITITEDK